LGIRREGGKKGQRGGGGMGLGGEYCTPPKFICEMAKRKRKKKKTI